MNDSHYDIIVIGAGHAGIEAALASARLNCRTAVFTMNLDSLGNMPCNPSVGGSSKGHIVREIDALGGEMALAADACAIQCRVLNLGKGPAVHSPRAQVDRRAYADTMKLRLERQEGLDLKQAEIVGLERIAGRAADCRPCMWRVVTRTKTEYTAQCVIIATGTFLRGRVHIGELNYEGGPDGMPASAGLTEALLALGIPLRRFKTGTPARVNRRSIDFGKTQLQPGDREAVPFSFAAEDAPKQLTNCYLTFTTEETKRVIHENLHRSPLYGGHDGRRQIEGVGPRYCPSIEDKVVRFAEKERHSVFIEPCGRNTREMYLQGLSSSLPEEVQLRFIRTIPGLERAEVMRPAYAIEYDCCDPLALKSTLEFRDWPGLFGAGQFNGSSGYEEAAAQGLMAGINAAHSVLGRTPFVLGRGEAYIGILIDDLVTKGCAEPYRMMTSRAEYRLLLRHDTADRRLTPYGYALGLISQARYDAFLDKQRRIAAEKERAERTRIIWEGRTYSLAELLRRPGLDYAALAPFDPTRPDLPGEVISNVETDIKYEGYLKRQEAQVREMRRLEDAALPAELDYMEISALRIEAREKLAKARPETLGQAARIAGVNPADVQVLAVWMKGKTT